MTGIPSRCCNPGCTSRTTISIEPPAGAGTTSVTTPEGQADCARATLGRLSAPSSAARRVSLAIGDFLSGNLDDCWLAADRRRGPGLHYRDQSKRDISQMLDRVDVSEGL